MGYIGTIIRTINGGTNWTSQYSGTTNDLEGVYFTDANNGTAVGFYGTILRTTNGGTNWILQYTGTPDHLYGVCFTDANTGTAVGWAGRILRTTNGGTNWISQIYGIANFLFDVSFIDANTGTTSGKNGTILRTTNGGTFPIPAAPILISPPNNAVGQALNLSLSWNPVTYASTYRVQLASDTNFTNIIVDDSTLINTVKAVTNLSPLTNYYWRVNAKNISGISPFSSVWHFKTLGYPTQVNLFYPPDDTTNIPVNVTFIWNKPGEQTYSIRTINPDNKDNRVIIKYWFELTTDTTGASLILDSTLTDTTKSVGGLPNPITYYWHIRAKNEIGWGIFSVWFKFTTIGTLNITGNSEIPKEFRLYNNYPNPFNPSTKIKFDIPKSSLVKLIVYDILGREIKTLVNEKLNAGRYEVNWDGSNYPSGVYIYKLVAEDFVNVKKMVLLK